MSISYLNSLTNRSVVNGFVFTGVYDDILSTSQITTRITNTIINNGYTLLVQYSNDKVNEVNKEIYYSSNNYNNLLNFTPSSRYFKLTFTLTSGDLDNLSIETIFKSAIVYKPFVAITGTVSVDNLPAISGSVSVNNWPETSNVNITTCIPLTISSLPAITIDNTGFTSNITTCIPLTIETLPSITIANTGFTSNITTCIPLTIETLPSIAITNTAFDSNITACIPLTIETLPSITIANTGFTSNITAIDSALTFQCQERPTTLAFHNNELTNIGVVLYDTPLILRNLSISNTSTTIAYVHIYNMNTIPTSSNASVFLVPIAPSVVSNIFNGIDHHFTTGLAFRATTTYNGNTSATANSVYLNGSYNLLV